MPQRIKYTSDYPPGTTLQSIFGQLQMQDTLFINQDYTLDTTVFLRQRQVTIFGRGAVISKGPNLGPTQPLIQIDNDPGNIVNDVVIDGLRLINTQQANGSGTSHAIRLKETLTGGLSHIRMQNLTIDNFDCGILLEDAFDIIIDNCSIQNCAKAIRPEFVTQGVGQIKIFGGYFIKNSYGISVDNSNGSYSTYQGQIMVFGVSFGHDRPGALGNIAVFVAKPIGGIFLFGSHFEDVSNVVYFADNFPNNTSTEPMVISAVANDFYGVKGDYAIDTRNAKPHVDAVCVIGNYNYASGTIKNMFAIPQIDTGSRGGLLLAGNALTNYPSEATAVQQNSYQVYPLPIFDSNSRPAANSVAKGTAIFNTSTSKINVSDGTSWRDANGNPV